MSTKTCKLCIALLMGFGIVLSTACSNGTGNTGNNGDGGNNGNEPLDPIEPTFSSSDFEDNSAVVTNAYFPLVAGTLYVYEGENDDGEIERIEINVSHDTRVVDGVKSAIVVDRVYVDDEIEEETFDWYAQDNVGNVWYMGEASTDFEDGEPVSTDGSWESGLDIAGTGSNAVAGIQMKQSLVVGDTYQQEFYPGEAEDIAEIVDLAAGVTLADGSTYTTLQIREWNPLEPDSTEEYKFYVDSLGFLLEEKVDGTERVELIESFDQREPDIAVDDFDNSTDIDNEFFPLTPGTFYTYEIDTDEGTEVTVVEVTSDTRLVMGITTRIVRDTVTLDGVVIEDTFDWYAQDNDGNVWYFGEEVDNYNYDDEGNFVDIDNDGSWEAGVDGAQPGIIMPTEPRVGDSYRQEYYEGEAEDLAVIDALDVDITLEDSSMYTALKIKEWNPLEEDSFEYKYYAPGVGLVREESIDGEDQLDLSDLVTP